MPVALNHSISLTVTICYMVVKYYLQSFTLGIMAL